MLNFSGRKLSVWRKKMTSTNTNIYGGKSPGGDISKGVIFGQPKIWGDWSIFVVVPQRWTTSFMIYTSIYFCSTRQASLDFQPGTAVPPVVAFRRSSLSTAAAAARCPSVCHRPTSPRGRQPSTGDEINDTRRPTPDQRRRGSFVQSSD